MRILETRPKGGRAAANFELLLAAGQELYDHYADQMEFNNLAVNPDPAADAVIRKLRGMLKGRASGKTPGTPFDAAEL